MLQNCRVPPPPTPSFSAFFLSSLLHPISSPLCLSLFAFVSCFYLPLLAYFFRPHSLYSFSPFLLFFISTPFLLSLLALCSFPLSLFPFLFQPILCNSSILNPILYGEGGDQRFVSLQRTLLLQRNLVPFPKLDLLRKTIVC